MTAEVTQADVAAAIDVFVGTRPSMAEVDRVSRLFATYRLAAQARAAKLAERLEWWPIETAPVDQDFLAAIKVNDAAGHSWWEIHCIWRDDETGDVHADCSRGWALADYSHWMPLPAPPDAAYNAEAGR